jgi:hypothetical protein
MMQQSDHVVEKFPVRTQDALLVLNSLANMRDGIIEMVVRLKEQRDSFEDQAYLELNAALTHVEDAIRGLAQTVLISEYANGSYRARARHKGYRVDAPLGVEDGPVP